MGLHACVQIGLLIVSGVALAAILHWLWRLVGVYRKWTLVSRDPTYAPFVGLDELDVPRSRFRDRPRNRKNVLYWIGFHWGIHHIVFNDGIPMPISRTYFHSGRGRAELEMFATTGLILIAMLTFGGSIGGLWFTC